MFTVPGRWWPVVIYTILYNVSLAGQFRNFYNITYCYVDSKYFIQAMAIKNSIAGAVGFTVSVFAGMFLNLVQNNNNTVFGYHVYGQQILSGISLVILIIMVVHIKFVIEEQDVYVQ